MTKNIRTQLNKVVGKSLDAYHKRMKPAVDELKFKEQYQGRIIDCMVGEVDDNYIETPETDAPIVKLEHSKEGVVKIPSIKGKTILVDADGNETDAPAEGCRLVSVGEEDNKLIILSKNKNLWNGEIINGNETDFISVFGNNVTVTMPTYRKEEGACYIQVDLFDKDKNKTRQFLMGDNYKRQSYSLTQDEFYIKVIGVKKEVPLEVTLENLPFLLHTSPNLVPIGNAKHHKTEILLDKSLKKLPNGVCDEVIDNKIIRKIGEVILDGNEDWKLANTYTSTYKFAHWVSTLPKAISRGNNKDQLSNKLTISNPYMETKNSVWIYGTQLRLFLDGSQTTVEEFKQWLNENPITLIYELAEPIIEELPNGITLQGFDDTTMYIENSITPTVKYGYNALIPYKEELRTQKEEVEINTLDIENNIIPYLMDMEFNLMTMEDNE